MLAKITPEELRGIADLLRKASGISLDEGKGYLIETRLSRLAKEQEVKTWKELAQRAARDTSLRDAIVDAMNGYTGIPGTEKLMVYRRAQIRRANERIVYLDEGRLSPNSWTLWYDQERWWDQITARHGDGTNFGFADGHSEYWKWKDPRTLDVAKMDYNYWQSTGRNGNESYSPGNEDLHRVQRGVWTKLGYKP